LGGARAPPPPPPAGLETAGEREKQTHRDTPTAEGVVADTSADVGTPGETGGGTAGDTIGGATAAVTLEAKAAEEEANAIE